MRVNREERARVLAARGSLRNAELAAAAPGALRTRTIEGEARKRRASRSRRRTAERREERGAW